MSSSPPPPQNTSISPIWPLTTTFIPPATCAVPSMSFDQCTQFSRSDGGSIIACGPHTSGDCLPTPFDTNAVTPTFSPGICPSGYTVAAATPQTGPTAAQTSLCCPAGLTYIQTGLPTFSGGYTSVCYSSMTNARAFKTITTYNGVTTILSATRTVAGEDLHQYAYQSPLTVVWASTDLAKFVPPSAPILGVSATSTAQTTAPSTAVPIQPATSTTNLSTSAKAGVGVGVAVAALITLSLLIWWWWSRRRNKLRRRRIEHPNSSTHDYSKAELPGDNRNGSENFPLTSSRSRSRSSIQMNELREGKVVVAEMQADDRYELPGDFEGHEVVDGIAKSPVERRAGRFS